jgi:hypothetical protein
MRHRWRARHRALRWGRPPGTGTPIATAEEDFWGPFDARFEFRPNTWQHPGITEPTPSVTVDLAPIFVSKPAEFAAAEGAVNALALLAMTRVFAPTERLLVLDWQHQSWWFRPHQQATREDWQWPVEVFPNGDYYAFLTEDMSAGTFGHPWEKPCASSANSHRSSR